MLPFARMRFPRLSHGPPPPRRRSRSWHLWGVSVGMLCLALGCENPNEIFTGQWNADTVYEGAFTGWPSLSLGHYGLEVAGIATFHVTEAGSGTVEECGCSLIEHRSLDLDARRLIFSTTCAATSLDWDLTMGETDDGIRFLEGTVRPVTTGDDPIIEAVRLLQDDETVDPWDPPCPPVDP